MAKILYAWELGSGLGHMAPYRGLFEKLCARGHSLTLVLRDLSRAKTIFKGLNVSLLQSPVHLNKPLNPIVPESTYAQILHNVGFEDVGELETRVSAWRGIFELTAPDMAISDHSPTAMVAWRGLPLRKIVFGSGFSIPPDTYPLGTIRAWQSIDSQRAKLDEDALCARVNRVLSHFGQPTLARIGQLFSDVDDRVFRSYPELDHYGPRQDETYWGLREGYQGEDFEWPAGDGPKIFAYLRCFERFEVILQALRDLKHPTLISSDRISEDMLRRFETKHLRIERRRFNMDKVCAECSVALLNTNHNTMCKLLLAGKPILNMPLTAEQEMLAVAVQRLGAGLVVYPERVDDFAARLSTLLNSSTFVQAAQRFAARYSANDPAQIDDQLVTRLEEILEPRWPEKRRALPSPLRISAEPQAVRPAPAQHAAHSSSASQRKPSASKRAAKILYAWELGSGLGHLAPCRGLFEKLCARGHTLTLALRDLSRATRVFSGLNLKLLQAPIKIGPSSDPSRETRTYTGILQKVGFEDEAELETLVSAWRRIFELVEPDLVIADHSPTAILALRGLSIRSVAIGCGFLIPPDTYPLQNMHPWSQFDEVQAKSDDDRMRERINRVLARVGAPPLQRIGQIFGDADERILTTFPELDHYLERKDGAYWGLRTTVPGVDFDWPPGDGPRIFCYLRPSQQFHTLLQTLKDLKLPTIVSSDQISDEMQRQFTTPHLRFERRLLNLRKLCDECSLAIVNGSHEMSCSLLLAGKPLLCIPLTLEKWIFAVSVQRLGAGLLVGPHRPEEFAPKLNAMLRSDTFSKAAQRFAARYAQNDPSQLEDALVSRLEEILDPRWPELRRAMPSPLKVHGDPLTTAPFADADAINVVPAATTSGAAVDVSMVRREAINAPAMPLLPPSESADGDESLAAAIAHHQSGRLEQAAKIYQSILARAPNAAALHLLGVVHLQSGQFKHAIELIERAIAAAPRESSFHSNLGEAYRALGQFDRAVECYRTALRLQPDYPEACNNLALTLQSQGKYREAEQRFRDALKYNPRYTVAYQNLASMLGSLGRFEEARVCLSQAAEAGKS